MSEDKQQNLTPAEQLKQDEGRVQGQLVVTDMSETAGRIMESFGFGNPRTGGRTSFEGHELNAMIDMVENSNPEHLESAGEALWKARDAMRRAAKELKDHLKGVDWQGESGTAFRAFGTGLVAHAEKLGDFADAAGTQITVAGTGLASVKSAMPPRDRRMIQTDVDDVLFPARTETNPQYAAALEVEKNRQEAINQINRLASYYSVSEEVLAGQEPPRFDKDLGIKMPKPFGGGPDPLPVSRSSTTSPEALGNSAVSGSSDRPIVDGSAKAAAVSRPQAEALGDAPPLGKSTATEINSAAPPQPPTTITGTPPLTSPTPTTGPTAAPPSFVPPNFLNTTQGGSPRSTGPAVPRPVNQTGLGMGKAQPTGGGPVAKGQGGGTPVGRPSPMGGTGSSTGRPPMGQQSPTAGRPGVTGGRPIAGQGGTSAAGGPRGGGRNGIVGGTPQQASQGRAAAGGSGQRGVIGGRGAAAAASRSGGRATSASGANGVVGAPRKAAGAGSNAKGFTAGGAGLVRGPAGRRNSGREEEDDNGSTRPDYLTEDEETWNAGRRGAVPPVVE
ncbi:MULTISPECIES: WXG100 family type VII secretion target [unclassified Streptomyces]|uniref:WXG100 family type VII secretion target n=1 Tax=unclassified Streptomyces TaxID=2593676 RepID=UPI0037B2B3C2